MTTNNNDKVRPAGTGRTSEASLRRATAMSNVHHNTTAGAIVGKIVPIVGSLALVGTVGLENAWLGALVAVYLVLAYLNGRLDQHAFSNTELGKLLGEIESQLDALAGNDKAAVK